MKKILLLLLLLSFKLPASFFNYYDDLEWKAIINDLNNNCDYNYNLAHTLPEPISLHFKKVLSTEYIVNSECYNLQQSLLNILETRFIKKKKFIQYQTKTPKFYLKDIHDSGFLNEENLSFGYSDYVGSLSYSFNGALVDNEIDFRNTNISFHSGSNIISIGKFYKWWSPSENQSLILSNQSEPLLNISIRSNIPKKYPYVSFLGPIEYDFFIAKLDDKERFVSNPKLLGMRLEFNSSQNLKWSLFRTAQFGGEGRSESAETIFNLLIGRDNRGQSGIDIDNEPGNQLAGLDFKYKINNPKNTYSIYGQFAGEDEAGYLPSRYMYQLGISKSSFNSNISLEFINTENQSGIKNYSYNHVIYKTGYRYQGMPIGASIDADSYSTILSYGKEIFNNIYFHGSIQSGTINKNNNDKNSWSLKAFDFNSIKLRFNKSFSGNISLNLIFNFTSREFHENKTRFKDNDMVLELRKYY